MTSNEIRQKFLKFFASKNHKIIQSDSLIPGDDPTLLFTGSGMNQFKDYFLGRKKDLKRAATCQRCLRTQDLDKVGRTAYHHTFFEMLGNFSFGDYFKREAIEWAWEFLTEVLKIDKRFLFVSVYKNDDESYKLWEKRIGIPKKRISRFGEVDNFWPANAPKEGPDGPCGPCSEIFYSRSGEDTPQPNLLPSPYSSPQRGEDRGEGEWDSSPHRGEVGRGGMGLLSPEGRGRERGRRIQDADLVEVWNLVFTQFDRQSNGALKDLPMKNIDTGMGLERLAAVMQKVESNFQTDLFKPIIEKIERETSCKERTTQNAIADHIRAITFAISDGIIPSNEERGYVIRKLLRKASWHCRSLGIKEPCLYKLVPVVADVMERAYPEIAERAEHISRIVRQEEEQFSSTVDMGMERLGALLKNLKHKKIRIIPGDAAFKLYDTYGFPVEITSELAKKASMDVDKKGFEDALKMQIARSKKSSRIAGEIFARRDIKELIHKFGATIFVGYDTLEVKSRILGLFKNGCPVDKVTKGDEVDIILYKTPFYGESGGQVGDTGILENQKSKIKNQKCEILDTKRIDDTILHKGKIIEGSLKVGDEVVAQVDKVRRLAIARNHTATHILHATLRELFGKHIQQSGSLVEPGRLRFDFTHHNALGDKDLEKIEDAVNEKIMNNDGIKISHTSLDRAKKQGALAFFKDIYKDRVRVVKLGDYSKELCAGTHLIRTGEIGNFKLISEESVAAGIRRIEAVTGSYAIQYERKKSSEFRAMIESLNTKIKTLERQLGIMEKKRAETVAQHLLASAEKWGAFRVISADLGTVDTEFLRNVIDAIGSKTDSAAIALGCIQGNKPSFIVALSEGLVKGGYSAVALAKEAAKIIGGNAGGRADFAQGGGKEPSKLKEALDKVVESVKR